MFKKYSSKLMALLMTLVMMMGFLPALSLNARAASVTEKFATEAVDGTTFSEGGITFSITGGYLKVAQNSGWGYDDSFFIENANQIPDGLTVVGSFKSTLSDFTVSSLRLITLDSNELVNQINDVKIRGKLDGAPIFTHTVPWGDINTISDDNYYTNVDLSSYSSSVIDELEFEVVGAPSYYIKYLMIDDFQFSVASAAPTVTAVSPASGATLSGRNVTITGTNLSGATSVKFGTDEASILSNSATQIIAAAPAHAAGTVDITVTTAGGTSATSAADQFTYSAGTYSTLFADSGGNSGGANAIITLSNGKYITAGSVCDSTSYINFGITVVRYNTNGTIDTTFGTDGRTVVTSGTALESGIEVIEQSDGKIVVAAGSLGADNSGDVFTMIRLTADGDLDTSFGTSGIVKTDIGAVLGSDTTDTAHAMISDSSGNIFLIGTVLFNGGGSHTNYAVAKYSANGVLDSAYGTSGVSIIDFDGAGTGYHYCTSGAFDANGMLVVGGSAYIGTTYYAAFARLNTDGSLDTTFDSDGMVTTTAIGTYAVVSAIALQPGTNKIVAVGSYSDSGVLSPFVVSLTDSGALSTIFKPRISDNNTYWEQPKAMACDSSGNIYLTGTGQKLSSDYAFGVIKVKSDLSALDTAFNTTGRRLVRIGLEDSDTANGVAIGSNGKIVVTGYVQSTAARYDEALIRINANGSLDNLGSAAPASTITNISPSSGGTAGGTSVTITGTNFEYGTTAIKFGASSASSFTVNSATQITATSPVGSAGTVHITVTSEGGTSATSANDQYTYIAPNTAPTVDAPAAITCTDTLANDTFTNITGTISATDSDGTIASYGITGGATGGSYSDGGVTYDVSKAGTYGTLYVENATGKYAYAPNATAINAVTANHSETFTVTATDNGSATGTATLTVNITGANDTPTDIALSNSAVNQSGGVNATVGTLSTTDADSGQTYTYSLENGDGTNDHDNGWFNISGTGLRANNAFTLAAGTYHVYVRTTDSGSLTYDKAFTVTVSDNVVPTVTSVTVPSNSSFKSTQNLDFIVNFTEAVTVVTTGGTPRIALTIGAATQYATYQSGSGTTALVFRYTVQNGDNDSDGIAVGVLALNGGTIKDAANNNATLTLNSVGSTANVLVDAVAPSTPTLAISSDTGTPGNDGVTKTSSQTITVSGENGSAVNVDFGDGSTHATGTIAAGTFTAAAHTYAAGKYTISVTLTDASGNVSTAGTKTVVIDTVAPSITTSADQYISATAAVYNATVCALTATDATTITGFTDALTWAITGGLDSGNFAIIGANLKINNGGGLGEGTYMVDVSVTDTAGNTGAITIAVHAVNGPTVGTVDKTYTDTAANDTFANQTGTISATANSGSITGYGISGAASGSYLSGAYDRSKAGTYGTLYVKSSDGSYAYVPSSDAALNALTATHTDTFTIEATDSGGTAGNMLTITINGVNDTPILTAPTSGSYTDTVASDSFSNTTGTLSGSDRDTSASLTYGILGGTIGGSTDIGGTVYDVSLAGTYGTLYVKSTTGAYVYDPSDSSINAVTANQSDTFTVRVSDGALLASQTYTVNVTGVNDSPTLNANNGRTLNEGASATLMTTHLLFSDVDTAATSLTFIVGTAPTHGTLYKSGAALSAGGTFTQDDIANSRITYTNDGSEASTDSFTFTVSDGTTTLPSATFSITVTPVNDAPVISSAATASFTSGGTGTAYAAAASDPEGSTLTWSITAGADAARFDINSSTGAVTFKTAPSYSTPGDSDTNNIFELTVSVTDGALADTQAITITVTAAPPTGGGASTGTDVEVNGESYSAGTTNTTTNSDGQTQTTVTVDTNKLNDILDQQGQGATVTIPVTNGSDVAAASLSGNLMNTLQDNGATLVIQTDTASYSLPANDIDMNAIAEQFGSDVDPAQVAINVSIAEPSSATVTVVAEAATDGGFTIMVPAVNFSVTASYNGQTTTVDTFGTYVQRTVAIPDGVDPSKITTGVVVDPDGTTHHVPTKVIIIDGKYYAVINSLTNSTYTVIWHPIEFADVTTSWAKDAINDMGSRMVMTGIGGNLFDPGRDISRAEFAAAVVRALGLGTGIGDNKFADIKSGDWYCPYIETAVSYGLVSGCSDGLFHPQDAITREQAMAILMRAMKLTGLEQTLTASDIGALLKGFPDGSKVSGYARDGVAACVKTGIVLGRDGMLAPGDFITRAEVAVIIRQLLVKSGLI